ncbi:MAG: hypothetical protein EA353_14750, partial [Puniceicoccaceae bacterium]
HSFFHRNPAMIKPYLSAFLLSVALSLSASGQTLSEVKTGASADLEAAMTELADLRASIREEKIPLARERRELEAQVRSLRAEAEAARSRVDNADVRLDQLRAQISGREEELRYVANLLDEYLRGMQARVHVSEVALYEERIRGILDSAETRGNEATAVVSLAAALDLGSERLRTISGGSIFEGQAVLPNGRFETGTFVLAGPLAYFANDSASGLVLRGESLRPAVETIANQDIAAAVASLKAGGRANFPVDSTLGNARAIEQTRTGLIGHIKKGGIWIIPILGFAFVSLVIAAFKALELYSIRMPQDASVHKLLDLLGQGKNEEAKQLAAQLPGPGGKMLQLGVRHANDSVALVEEICIEKVIETQPKTQRLLAFIATTAAVSPLLGLLGTVTGMITTFELITIFGTGDARNLSSGISEALVTTEFGLIVAIPALIFHAVLSRKANSLLATMEKHAITFTNGLKITREQA